MTATKRISALHVIPVTDDAKVWVIHCRACAWISREDVVHKRQITTLRNLKKCPKCGKRTIVK